jgi:HAD superfamily hydrolase (TIGR01509 family)
MAMIRLIIFDFSGTLAHYDAGEHKKIFDKLREFNLPVKEEKTGQILKEALPEFFCQAESWQDMANKIIQKLGIVMETDRRHALVNFLERKLTCKLYDDVADILYLPQDKAILTLSEKFVVDSIPELRHFSVFSPRVTGAAKPELKAFLAVLAKMKADPEETAMVGDSLENDILPARAIGMRAILIDRIGKYSKLYDKEIIKIKTLKELKHFL